MATKRNKTNPAQLCTCSTCGIVANSIAGTKHRRCGGNPRAPRLAKHTWAKAPGRWQPGVQVGQGAA